MDITCIFFLLELRAILPFTIPYSGKFLYGANFRIFRMLHPLYENKNCENLNVRNCFPFAYHNHKRSLAAGAKCKASSLNDVYRFFAKALKRSDLSDPSGPISASITIKEASGASVTIYHM